MSNFKNNMPINNESEDEEEEVILFKPKGGIDSKTNNNKTDVIPSHSNSKQLKNVASLTAKQDDLDAAVLNLMTTLKISPSTTTTVDKYPTLADTSPILLVLDMNGILVYREKIEKGKRAHQPVSQISSLSYRQVNNFRVWDRPNLDSFLDFVFTRFKVAIWSSTRRDNLYPIVETMLGKERVKHLAFVWDQSHCLAEERVGSFPLYLKDIRKIWTEFPKYAKGRILLVDDDEHKARLNPKFTAIHPQPWTNLLMEDQELGPLGSIRMYLDALANEALSNSELKVEDFIQTHPFPSLIARQKNINVKRNINNFIERSNQDPNFEKNRPTITR